MKTLRKIFLKTLKWLIIIGVFTGLIASTATGIYLYQLSKELPPDLVALEEPDYALPTVIYDRNGNQIEEIYIQRRIVVPFENFPPHLIQAVIASEDTRFFSHFGIDPIRMLKAFIVNIRAKRFEQGASTLTQQTARLFLLSREKKLVRKLKEILLAMRIERQFTKEEILTLYFNKVFLGNAEGIEASAQGYFGKHTEELSLPEVAMIVGLLPAPSNYSPYKNPDKALERRDLVLKRMAELGFISEEERQTATSQPIRLTKIYDGASEATAYYVEHIRRYLIQKYGYETLYKGGLKVHLAMDLEYQIYAHEALQEGIQEISKRQGYLKSENSIATNLDGSLPQEQVLSYTAGNEFILGKVVDGVIQQVNPDSVQVTLGNEQGILIWDHLKTWKLKSQPKDDKPSSLKKPSELFQVGDVAKVTLEDWDHEKKRFRLSLYQYPEVNGALFTIDPATGEVLAMTGGYSYEASEFNRAIQAQRQPGSAFKPFVYTTALESGYTLISKLIDSPRHYKFNVGFLEEEEWNPKNYGNKFKGEIFLKDALAKSLNLPTVGLTEELTPQRIIQYAHKLGITSEIPPNLSIGLGSLSATLEEMVTAYAAYANLGTLPTPIYITRILDKDGQVLEEHKPSLTRVLSKETAFLVSDILRTVVRRGTGVRARELGRPAAGKTGTTNDSVDAWFIGYIPQLLAGVYVGYDQPRTMGRSETGSQAALPIWLKFMKSATTNLVTERFVQPPGIVTIPIHQSGRRAVPCDPKDEVFYEHFKIGTQPPLDPVLANLCNTPSAGATTSETDIEL